MPPLPSLGLSVLHASTALIQVIFLFLEGNICFYFLFFTFSSFFHFFLIQSHAEKENCGQKKKNLESQINAFSSQQIYFYCQWFIPDVRWGEGIKILKLIILRVLQIFGFTFWWKKSHMEKLAIGTKNIICFTKYIILLLLDYSRVF